MIFLTHPSYEDELRCAEFTDDREHSANNLTYILQLKNPQQRKKILNLV